MNSSLPKPLRTVLIVTGVIVAIAATLAVAVLAIAQFFPDEIGSGRIQWGDHSTTLSGVFSGSLLDFMLACAAMTLAILIAFAAIVFALLVTALALTVTASVLLLAAVLVGLPLIVIAGIVCWVVRRNRRHSALLRASPQI